MLTCNNTVRWIIYSFRRELPKYYTIGVARKSVAVFGIGHLRKRFAGEGGGGERQKRTARRVTCLFSLAERKKWETEGERGGRGTVQKREMAKGRNGGYLSRRAARSRVGRRGKDTRSRESGGSWESALLARGEKSHAAVFSRRKICGALRGKRRSLARRPRARCADAPLAVCHPALSPATST